MFSSFYKVLLVLIGFSLAASAAGYDTLLFYTDNDDLSTYSQLVSTLEENNLNVFTHQINHEEQLPILDVNNNVIYKNLLILPNKAKKLASNIDSDSLLQYANKGGNVIVVTDNSGPQLDVNIFLNQLGIYPAPKGYKYIDYHNNGQIDPKFLNKFIVNLNDETTLSFESPSVALISNSEYLIPLLQTPKSSFTTNLDLDNDASVALSDDSVWHSGNQGYLSVAFQGLNNGRILWLGSPSILADKDLDTNIIQWTYQLKSVIKATFSNHKRVDSQNPDIEIPFVDADDYYKVKDTTFYQIGLSKYEGDKDKWVPYTIDDEGDHVQLEFIMLDPYYRLNLNHTGSTESEAIYSALFKIPDQHGMFTFSVDYRRPGLSFVTVEEVVPIRHLANDEYARSWEIPNSSVYMAGYGVVVIGWLFFIVFYIFSSMKNISSVKKNEWLNDYINE